MHTPPVAASPERHNLPALSPPRRADVLYRGLTLAAMLLLLATL